MAQPVCILIVDDEPALLRLMQAYLERLGYQITACPTATEALGELKAEPGKYAVVVADLSLPDMPGDAMARQMVESNPNLRILLCSGYPFEIESLPAPLRNHFAALQKPFLPNMLAKEVEGLLNR